MLGSTQAVGLALRLLTADFPHIFYTGVFNTYGAHVADLTQSKAQGDRAPEVAETRLDRNTQSDANREQNPLVSSTIGTGATIHDVLLSLQCSRPILNLPAGERTETPVFSLPDVPRVDFITPEMVATYLAQDRAELHLVARLASQKVGRDVAPEEALQMITERMVDLIKNASVAVKVQDESRVLNLLNYLSRGQEIDPSSWRYRIAEKCGFVKSATAEEYLAPDSQVSIMKITHFKVGEKIFAINGGSKRSELSAEIGEVAKSLDRFKLNPHLQTPETIAVMQDQVAVVARKLGLSEHLLSASTASFEDGRYQLGAMGMISLARNGRDFIISFRNSAGESENVRLNIPQIQNAERAVFPKWDPENPPKDVQQRWYPTSPLKFWMDHLEPR